jgi:hypothetical protein
MSDLAAPEHTFISKTDVMILKIFSPKNFAKKLAFFTQNKTKLCKNFFITLVFEKNANYFAENCQKSQKIVIITSTPVYFFRICFVKYVQDI